MSYVYLVLLSVALVAIECLLGGTRLLYSLPAYGLLALAAVSTLGDRRRPEVSPNAVCVGTTILCFGYLLVRCLESPVAYLARADIFAIVGCLIVYWLVAFYLTKAAYRLVILGVLLVIACMQVGVGLIQFTRDGNFMLFGFLRGAAGYAASGMYISHNHLAGYAEMVGVMALSIALWGRTKLWIRLLVGYGAVVCYVGVVIAGSRGGYLSTIVSLVVFALLSLAASAMAGRDKAIIGSVVVVMFAIMAAAGAAALMSHNFALDQKLKRITSDEIRSSLWKAAWDQFHTSPAVGTGAGTHLYYGRLFRQPTVESDPVHVHNDYLELLAEYGVVGALGMILFLVAHAGRGIYAVRWLTQKSLVAHEHGSSEMGFQIGAISAISALVAHSLVDFNLHIPGNALVCAFFFAVLANPGVAQSDSAASPKARVSMLRFVLPSLGLWFLGLGAWQSIRGIRNGLNLAARGAWTPAMVLPGMPGEYYAEEARVALRDGKFEDVVELAKTGVRHDPQNPYLYFYLGEGNRVLGLRAKRPGLRNVQRAHYEEAVTAFRSGLQLFPQDIQLLLRLGQTLDGLKQFDEAEVAYAEAVKNDPNLAVVRAYYGAHLERSGRSKEAEDEFQRARALAHHDIGPLLQELRRP